MSRPRRVAIVLTTRGNYAKMKSTMRAVRASNDLTLITLVGGGILQQRFGDFRPILEDDGFQVDAKLDFLIGDGATVASQTESAGLAVKQMGDAIGRFEPDVVLVVADRWEALAIALAATTMNVAIAHLEGGEVSGSIDERMRHAVTKLAHLHLPANENAATRIRRMGEEPSRVVVVGTPSLDLLSEVDLGNVDDLAKGAGGQGDEIDFRSSYIVVSQHPVVTEVADAERQAVEISEAVKQVGVPIVWMLPNMDAGGQAVIRAVERMGKGGLHMALRVYPSMRFEHYSVLLANASCLVGNSSSGIRECAFLGTPVVNVGSRQTGRERGRNVVDVGYDRNEIAAAIARQTANGHYPSDAIYGDGNAGCRIAEALAKMPLTLDKTIAY